MNGKRNDERYTWRVGLALLIIAPNAMQMAQMNKAPEFAFVFLSVMELIGLVMFIVSPTK